MDLRKYGAPVKNIEIIPQKKETQPVASSILAHFAAPSTDRGQVQQTKTISNSQSENTTLGVSAADSIELTVFKHKGVNTLIRSRILALENSVVSKTVEKQPLQEVDRTIKEVKKEHDDSAVLELLMRPREEPAALPTSKIREIAKEMHNTRPMFDITIPIVAIEERETVNKSVFEDKPLKPILTKQYSFSMDKKFHEENDARGWKKVNEISVPDSSSESECDTDESDEVTSENEPEPLQPRSETQSILNVERSVSKKDESEESESSESSVEITPPEKNKRRTYTKDKNDYSSSSSTEDIKQFDNETVKRILYYDEHIDVSPFESFEEYLRRRNENPGYDSDIPKEDINYESDAYTNYSENTNAFENDSFVNEGYAQPSGYYGRRTEDFVYTDASDFDDDSVFNHEYNDRNREYYREDDEQTLVDEEEYGPRPHYTTDRDYKDNRYSDEYSEYSDYSEYPQEQRPFQEEYFTDEHHYPQTKNHEPLARYDSSATASNQPTDYEFNKQYSQRRGYHSSSGTESYQGYEPHESRFNHSRSDGFILSQP